jgi:signal transduction histidine kinase/CheY-like chemotaxis protein
VQAGFTPTGETYLWSTDLLFLHVGSDTLIALSFLSISVAMVTLLRRRPDDSGIFFRLAAGVIFLSALTHLCSVVVTWYPAFYIEGSLKFITAVVAAISAIIAWPLLPQIISTPSRAEMERRNRELEELNRRLQNRIDSLSTLAGGVSHDFNNLLTVIKGHSRLLGNAIDDESNRQSLSAIEEAANRAADVCRQMLSYSGRGHFLLEELDLNGVIENAALLPEQSINQTFSLSSNLKPINASPSQIAQLVTDLYANAIEAIHESEQERGEISISTYETLVAEEDLADAAFETDMRAGHAVILEIRDNGVGMSNQITERVFEPYYSTKFIGRGLGMAAVQGIVRGHQGALFIDSTPNGGTTIRLAFPLHPVDTVRYREPKFVRPDCVLVVDDQPEVLSLAESYLNQLGIKTYSTTEPSEALRLAAIHKSEIEAVVLDYLMPHTTGSDLLRAVSEHIPGSDAYLTSGYSRGEIDDPSLRRLLTGFIAKPFVFEDFQILFDQPGSQ